MKLISPITPAEQLLFATVRIEGVKGEERWTGTGFIVVVYVEADKFCPILITNRHVINDADNLTFKVHVREDLISEIPSGEFISCDFAKADIFYPDSDEIDLAAVPISGFLEQLESLQKPAFIRGIGTETFPSDEVWSDFDVMEDIIMIGCPNGLYDSTNNFAIFREGVTASSLIVDYDGRPEFLMDIACFGGSSGSPVFSYNPISKYNRKTKKMELGGRGLWFVGVLYAGPTYLHEGQVIMRIPVVNLRTTMHLGFAIKSTEVRKLMEKVLVHFGFVELAEQGGDPAQYGAMSRAFSSTNG